MSKSLAKFWKNKTVFVTGANGFLGSHLCEELIAHDATVIGLVRDDVPNSYFVRHRIDQKITIIHGDLENAFLLERVFNEYEVDVCFHLAAQPIVTIANRSPRSTFESNIAGTWNVLEAARKNARLVKGVVVASSDKAYGDSDQLPYVENYPLAAKNPYDLSKTCTDLLAQSYAHTYDLPILVSRCGNFYGPGDLNWSRIVPGGFRSFLRGEKLVLRSDGSPIRDYFFIKDVVSAYLALGEHVVTRKNNGEAFNFGTGEHVSVLAMVKKMQAITGRTDDDLQILGTATHEIAAQYLNWEKAKKILQWSPQVSLDQGLQQTYAWYKKLLTP